ncbi:MAG: IS4 family transposase [Deltaproteobacteria bacterium]|nr:IS4 family transposase [Deltaproteobacteria bacterium]
MGEMGDWVTDEMASCDLGDKRLDDRQARLLRRLSAEPDLSIPAACKGLAETMAAYRFFDNDRVSPERMLAPHAAATVERLKQWDRVLLVQDTTELDFTGRDESSGLGPLNWAERVGLFDHSMLAFTAEGLCLGVVDADIWTRHGPPQKRKRKSKPIEQKESMRWLKGYRQACEIAREAEGTLVIVVADREGDIYELFVEAERAAQGSGRAEWIVRACQDRSLPERRPNRPYTHEKLWEAVRGSPAVGIRTTRLPRRCGRPEREAKLEVRLKEVVLKAPFRKGRKLPDVAVRAVLASEVEAPEGEEPVEWMLLTSLAVCGFTDACTIIDSYLQRWQIEVYYRVLKGACCVESLQLRSVDRLKRCIMLKKIVAWRALFVTHLSRVCPEAPCTVAFEDAEWKSAHVVGRGGPLPSEPPPLSAFVALAASFGGYLGRKGDGPPGPIRLCIGLQAVHHYATAWLAFGPEGSRDV